ncbi:MAG: GAF domain-containing protein [Anaerolineae bacterium]|nr:GAF domain-containing protein [Anaerolineae bacterium]
MSSKAHQDLSESRPARSNAAAEHSEPLARRIAGRRPLAWVVLAVLSAAVLLLAGAAFLAWHTTRVPFPGLLTEPTLVVNGLGDKNWSGYAAGLRYMDHLLALNGRPLNHTRALIHELAHYRPGDVVFLTARRPRDTLLYVSVQLTPLPAKALVNFFILPYVLALTYLGIGWWVFLLRRDEVAGRVFGLLCAVVALGLGLLFDLYTTHWLCRLWVTAISLSGSIMIHLALVFPQRPRFLERAPLLSYLAYVPGVLIAIVNQFTLYNFEHPMAYFGTWRPMFLFAAMGAAAFLAMMVYRVRHSPSPIVSAQARIILGGGVLAFSPIAIWFVVSRIRDWFFSPLLILPWLALFPLSIAYAILRYRLLNINLVISRSLAYALLSIAIVVAYFLALFLISLIFGITPQAHDPVVLGIFVLVLSLLLNPVRAYLQQTVDRIFLREAVNQQQLMHRFTARLTETTTLSSVLQVLGETIEKGWKPQFAALFLYDPQRACYTPRVLVNTVPCPEVSFGRDGPLARHMLEKRESLYLFPDRPLPQYLQPEHEGLKELCSSLLIPVPGHGWLTLGSKRSGAPFTSEDLYTLESLASQIAVALEKARLFTDLERRMVEVDALRWIGQAVNFTMAVDDLMELIYAQTSRVLDTRNFYIALYNQEKGTLSFAFYVEEGERLYKDDEWSVQIGLTGQIVRTGRPIVTDDYLQECARRKVMPGGRPGKAWMGVPLSAGDRILGVMTVSSFDPAVKYDDEQLRFFSAVADQAAAILEKARLYREMEAHTRRLTALNEVGSVITSTLDLPTVLRLIMDRAVELLQAEAGSLVLVDQETGELVFEVTAGPASADLVGTRLPPGTGILGSVVQERDTIIIRDAQSDPRWGGDLDERFVTRSIIAVPMISRGQVIGVIELLNRRDGLPFDENDARLLTAFAANAAVSIENARLFTQTDQALAARVEELSMMQRIDRELNATLDYRLVMKRTLSWAVEMTGADVGLIAVIVENDKGEKGLRFLAAHGYPEKLVAPDEARLWPLERGIIGRVARTGRAELVENVAADPDYASEVPGMVTQLTVPIIRETRIVGIIALESSRPGQFNQEVFDFVMRLADHAAIAIENARLFEQVRQANEAKTEFVSFVSHELKQPMTSMRGYTDLLLKGAAGELSEIQRSFLETIRSNVERMNALVTSLLDISRIESGRLRINLEDLAIGQVIEDVLRQMRGQIEAKRQTLAVEIAPGLPYVRADRERLGQVLTNLISNAHKYTPEGGHITVRAQQWEAQGGRFVMCAVSDTGIGMSPEDQARLFTKYFRSDDPAVRKESGTGLGLVITKSLVELQGGEIWVESEVGKGSTFTFTVPVSDRSHSVTVL